MSYYTSYELEVRNIPNENDFNELRLYLQSEKHIIGYALDTGDYTSNDRSAIFFPTDCVKWYDHEEDMVDVSKHFPDYVFRLYGTGESNDDMWYQYFHNGKEELCSAEISFPEPTTIKWEEL